MVIYKITNLINGKIYIGKSKYNDEDYYGSGLLIKRAIQKYGKENFTKEILEVCDNEDTLNEQEISWIKKCNSLQPKGYNITEGGTGGDTISNHPNIEVIKDKLRNKKPTKHSQEWIEYLKESRKGEGNPFYGKKHTDEKKHLMGHWKGKKLPKEMVDKSTYLSVIEFSDRDGNIHKCIGVKDTRSKIQELEQHINNWHKCCWEKLRDLNEYRGYKLISRHKESVLELQKQNLL